MLLGLAVTVGGRSQEVPPSSSVLESSWFLDGYLDLRYSYRADSERRDQDLREVLSFSFGEARTRWIAGHVSLYLAQDLDGFDNPDAHPSLRDTEGRYYTLLDSAYVELRPGVPLFDVARVGRQWLEEVPEIVRMDGIHLQSRELE